jgi:hypothetical protein
VRVATKLSCFHLVHTTNIKKYLILIKEENTELLIQGQQINNFLLVIETNNCEVDISFDNFYKLLT